MQKFLALREISYIGTGSPPPSSECYYNGITVATPTALRDHLVVLVYL